MSAWLANIRAMANSPSQPRHDPTAVTLTGSQADTVPGPDAPTQVTPPMSVPSSATQQTIATPQSANSVECHQHKVWGDFELGTLLGKGGMGAVYRGRQLSLDRPVAIKVLPSHLSGNEQFKKRFLLEARAVAQISSPHVVQVYAAGEHEGHHYFAMEYVEGEDLAHRLKNGFKPTPDETLALIIQAARGLAAAGEHDIVHRDIKPGNMMVTGKNIVKLMDFGLVRLARNEDTGLTRAGTIMGTVSYFSPEQGRGEVCDQRTDIYALGVVFYELLTGRLPFTGDDATSVIYQHIHVPPRSPREINPTVPEDFQAVVLKCLQKDPQHRYRDANALLEDLDDLKKGIRPHTAFMDPQQLRRGGMLVKSDAFVRERARRRALMGLAGALAVLVGGGIIWWRFPRETPQAAPVPTVVNPLSADPISVAPVVATVAPRSLKLARAQLAAKQYPECRAQVDAARAASPDDQDWQALGKELDQAEGRAELQEATAAINRGDQDAASRHAAVARARLGDDPAVTALFATLTARDSQRRLRGKQLEEADNLLAEGKAAEAEALLTKLKADQPDDATVDQTLRRAHKQHQDQDNRDQAVHELLGQADQAVTRRDFDAAFQAFAAAKQLDPANARASAGLESVTQTKQEIESLRKRFDQALKDRSLVEAERHLTALRATAPGSSVVVLAEKSFDDAKQAEAAERRAAAEREASLSGEARALANQLDDLTIPVAQLETAVATYVGGIGATRPERPLIEQKLEDRHQRARFTSDLTALDQALASHNGAAIAARVSDTDYAKALTRLTTFAGLVFDSRLAGFERRDRTATATVFIRHALAVYPERTLTYRYDLRQTTAGWTIAAAQLQP